MNDKYEERLGTDRMLPLVFRMALPAVIAQIVNLLYNIVDRIYIGHIPGIGTQALAGIGVAGSLIILISAFSAIVAGGGAPLAAIALGQGNRTHAGKILGNGFVLLLFFTLLTSGLSYLFMEPILLFTGASEQTLGYATAYLSIYLIGTLFVEVSVGLNTFINTQGRPGIAMLSIVIGALLNILLDPLFIFVFDWGVKGAALATIISQACSAGWVLFFLTSRRASLRLEPRYMRLDRKVVGAILALGASPFIMASTESLVGFVLNGSLKTFGDIYVSALTIMQSAMLFVSVPLAGFALGFVPIVSYNYGHGNRERVKECFKIVMTFMFLFNLVLILLMILFPSVIAFFISSSTLLGVSIFIALLRKVILLIPLALMLPYLMGVMGVYAAEAISDAAAAICCTVIFAVQFPRIMNKLTVRS